jgi:nucleotide-binding universal stress UspA family protein
MLADLSPHADFALRAISPLVFRQVSRRNYERLLAQIAPAFRLVLRDPLGGPELDVDLRVQDTSDLGVRGLVKCASVIPFLDALSGCELPPPQVSGLLERLFRDRADSLQKLVRSSTTFDFRIETPTEPSHGAGAQLPHHEILDRLLGHVDLPESVPSQGATAVGRSSGASGQPELQQRLHAAVSAILEDALSHEEFRRIRRAWQSLRTLSEAQNDCSWTELHVIGGDGTATELRDALERLEPDLLVLEAPMSACARDADRLVELADWADQHGVPVIATLAEDWFVPPGSSGNDARHPSRAKLHPAARRLMDAIGSHESARWLMLCANDVCDSAPAAQRLLSGSDGKSDREFEQSGESLGSYTFVPAGVNVAKICMRTLLERGHPFAEATSQEAKLRSAAVRVVGTSGASEISEIAIGTRFLATADDASDLARVGVCCLVPTRNRDSVTVQAFPTAFRPRTLAGDRGSPVSTLAEQLLAGRVTRLLRASKVAYESGASAADVTSALQGRLESLFPNPPPVSPDVFVRITEGALELEVDPHRYEGLGMQGIQASLPLS